MWSCGSWLLQGSVVNYASLLAANETLSGNWSVLSGSLHAKNLRTSLNNEIARVSHNYEVILNICNSVFYFAIKILKIHTSYSISAWLLKIHYTTMVLLIDNNLLILYTDRTIFLYFGYRNSQRCLSVEEIKSPDCSKESPPIHIYGPFSLSTHKLR